MIKAEKYFKDYCAENNRDLLEYKYDFIVLIKKAQKDAIKRTCEFCAENTNVNSEQLLDCAEILMQTV